ncbi:MAG: PKD domain-containing protein, partial [Acidobacteriota bacterium]
GAVGAASTAVESGFFGANNNDNGRLLGFLIAPPDTDGAVGPTHYVQMINLLTTIYDKNGSKQGDSFPSNAIWAGLGGNCEAYNQGDPIVLYDDLADRWVFSQFAFPDNMASFSQCVAVSQTNNPAGGYNRYEFPFTAYGFNDYPKHGIVTNSITMTANLFKKRGASFYFGGTFLGVMDKVAMYAGETASLIGYNIGTAEFGFVAGDLDGPGTVPALFATAMSSTSAFDIWKLDVDWTTDTASVGRIARVPVAAFDKDLCSATREACIPQPDGGPALEAISDRLMHRLQVRDFGGYRTMVTAHTVDAGSGRAGIRWYELRESGGAWSLYQQGTYAPADGKHRFIPSAAMNAAGDIGIGYLLSSTTTYVSTAVAGQSAASSGSGTLDSAEVVCAAGTGVQEGTGRSGDYSATSVDPNLDTFWHTNEVFTTTGNFQWATYVCEFSVGSGGTVNQPPTAGFTYACTGLACAFTDASSDGDGTITARSWNFGDGATSTLTNPSHTYAAAGTYSVALTVTDDDGATDTETKSVTVTAPTNFTLSVRGYKVRTKWRVDLTWSGATGTSVDVFKNGAKLTTTPNDGLYTDAKGLTTGGTYRYKVCNAGTTTCSNEASVTLN